MTFTFILAALTSLMLTGGAVTLIGTIMARMGFPLPEGNRIGHIDGLRGYLATSVLACHLISAVRDTAMPGITESSTPYFFGQLGLSGVALFFMTTGLVFYPRIRKGFQACDWRAIYISRAFRILPLSVFAFAVVCASAYSRTHILPDIRFPVSAARWILGHSGPAIMGYAEAWRINSVIWSLWYEWLFYWFVLPACALAMDLMRGRLPSWSIPLALFAVGLAGRLIWPQGLALYLPLFACGMFALEIGQSPRMKAALQHPLTAPFTLAALLAGMAFFKTPYSAALPVFAVFFFAVANGNSFFGAFATRGALVLGEISFSIYLLHDIVLNLVFSNIRFPVAAETQVFLMPAVGVAVVLLSAATYLGIERPLIAFGRTLARALQNRGRRQTAITDLAS